MLQTMSSIHRLLIGTVVLALSVTAGAVAQATLDMRVGQWEMTLNGMQMPPAALEKLPPAARATVQAEMAKPHTSKSCITAQDLKDLNLGKMDDDDSSCKVTSRNVTRTTADFTRECTGDEKRTDVMHIEAATPTTFKANVKSTTEDGTMTVAMTGKWIGAACKED